MAKKTKQPNREQLEALATEMNLVMGLEPPIKISKKLDDEGLIEKIKEEAEGQIYASDFEEDPGDDEKVVFSAEAATTLMALGVEVADDENGDDAEETEEVEEEEGEEEGVEEKPKAKGKTKKEEPKKGAKGKKVDVEEEEEETEEEEEDPKPKKAAKGKKEEPEEEEEEEEEKPAKKAAKGAKEAPKAKAKGKAKVEPKKGKKVKYTRSEALVDALKSFKKGATKKEIVLKSDELYVEKGGDSGLYVSEVMFRYTMPALLLLGHAEQNDDKYKLV